MAEYRRRRLGVALRHQGRRPRYGQISIWTAALRALRAGRQETSRQGGGRRRDRLGRQKRQNRASRHGRGSAPERWGQTRIAPRRREGVGGRQGGDLNALRRS